jgi:hypothetical protein
MRICFRHAPIFSFGGKEGKRYWPGLQPVHVTGTLTISPGVSFEEEPFFLLFLCTMLYSEDTGWDRPRDGNMPGHWMYGQQGYINLMNKKPADNR